jgi:hypothetical protein
MVIDSNAIFQFVLYLFLFPNLFQGAFLQFAWGADDQFWIMLPKRLFLLLPALAVIASSWLCTPTLLTLIFRHKRGEFIMALFITWWDLGKAILFFWGGIFKFALNLVGAVVGMLKITVFGVWSVLQEILFLPFRVVRNAGKSVVASTIPWIAVFLTIFWCLIEALIFSYVTSPLVSDTLSNITGETLSVPLLRIPLFIFLFFVVLGSYSVLSNLVTAVKSKSITAIAGIGVVEFIVLMVEVVFLYREFVDSLVPWFAQYSEGFELGIFWTLAIACFAWFGIRSISWFLFAAHGTPPILSIIQGKGLGVSSPSDPARARFVAFSTEFLKTIKEESNWVKTKGDELLASFMLPPLQVVGAVVNVCLLLVSGKHLFQLPFTSMDSILSSKSLVENHAPKVKAAKSVREEIL